MASPAAELISPIRPLTPSASIMRWALLDAVAGLTLSSEISSTCRPSTPPAALASSTASVTPITACSPAWPRKPVSGVRWPIRIGPDCARSTAGKPSWPAASAPAPAAAVVSTRRRESARLDTGF
jgi:hypothetical protein